ncbi:hypothetical protein PFZ49_08685 [Microbacterium lacticum]|uniref:hypothetical protein n=1 Tax=Microbacterium lacticum TaxID=33885 RepID=UPI003A88CC8E
MPVFDCPPRLRSTAERRSKDARSEVARQRVGVVERVEDRADEIPQLVVVTERLLLLAESIALGSRLGAGGVTQRVADRVAYD